MGCTRGKAVQAELIRAAPKSTIDLLRNAKEPGYFNDGYIEGYLFSHQFISEIITQCRVDEWNCRTPICLAAQTGTGKSSLVFNKVWGTVKKRGKKLCVLASRTVLVQQYKRQAAELEEPNLINELTDEGFRRRHSFGDIDIFSYQEIIHLLLKNPSGFFKEYGAVIFDECHFFVQDAPYNELTQELLESLIDATQHSVRIYLTATPDTCLETIINLEYQRSKLPYMDGIWDKHLQDKFLLYYFENNYDYLKPCFFKEDSEIIDVIKSSPASAKYLICVDSKEQGQTLAQALGKETCEYIDAELKNTLKADMVNTMVRNEKFDKKVLIATAFLDVGVNLKDENLQNIVIYSTEKTHFLQSIGRKRKLSQQPVSLYIHIPSSETVSNHLKRARFKRMELDDNVNLYCNSGKSYLTDMPDSIYIKKTHGKNQIRYNGLAFTYWDYRIQELGDMLESLKIFPDSDEAFARYILKWLGLEQQYGQAHWLGKSPEAASNEFIQFIENHAQKEMSEDEFSAFKAEFQKLYNKLYPRTKMRKDRLPHLKKLNDTLNELGFPYIIANAGNSRYVIKKG